MITSTKAVSIEGFHTMVEEGFYLSEVYLMNRVPALEFKLASTVAGLVSISRFSGIDVGVRRQWKHIRSRSSDMYVIWFPLGGAVSITQDKVHDSLTGVGEFVITCGDRPFHSLATSPGSEKCSQLFVLVPTHTIRSYLPNIDKFCGHTFRADSGAAKIAREIFSGLIDDADQISPEVASRLALSALAAIAESAKQEVPEELILVDSKKAHLERVLRFIDQHLSTQGLTCDRVAIACKVSRRYVHYLMRYHNTTFGEYLWNRRLKQANEWLLDPEFSHFHIVDIAYMCGFRSASHFSNCYRSYFGYPARDARLVDSVKKTA
jgi:AraC-like DNA-binding protein